MARILVAEDDRRIGPAVEAALRQEGLETVLVDNGEAALQRGLTDEFDLVLLDMGLPEREGLHVLQELRAQGKTVPILVLTGMPERDVVLCLEAGADDYMRKPFEFPELLARVRLRLSRPRRAARRNLLTAAGITLDLNSRRASAGTQTVELSPREFAVLETLMRHPGQILTRNQLFRLAWGDSFDAGSNVVEVAISLLRKKLGDDVVDTVRGAGYRLGTA